MSKYDGTKLADIIKAVAKTDPQQLDIALDIALHDEGVLDQVSGNRHIRRAVGNPQANWEKLMYVPRSFKPKTVKGPDGKAQETREMTDEEKRRKVWGGINLRNILGDTFSVLLSSGALAGSAIANGAERLAKTSATEAQRQRFGATPSDRAAAAASPLMQATSSMLNNLGSLIANRLYQSAADQRASYLQALMDSEYNNLGGIPGMYADSRRKLGQPIDIK